MVDYRNSLVQWGSEIWPFKIRKHLKSGLFEDQIPNSPDFKGSGNSYGPNHSKTLHFEIKTFLSGFQMVLDKMQPFAWILKQIDKWITVFFLNIDPPKESIFLTTFYGLYFSRQYKNITNYISSCSMQFHSNSNLINYLFSMKNSHPCRDLNPGPGRYQADMLPTELSWLV